MIATSHHRRGFTLVELLVVIGVIALLIALLMPTLGAARQQAQRVACEAKLHNIMIAAQLHANEHQGYYPLAGVLPSWLGSELDDPYATHFAYLPTNTTLDPNDPNTPYFAPYFSSYVAPITVSLAAEMSYKQLLQINNNNDLGTAETDPHGFIRNFLCPSQAASVDEIPQLAMLYSSSVSINIPETWGSETWSIMDLYWEQQSYNFNEAILGWTDSNFPPNTSSGRLHGKVALIRQPAKTMFACDGLMGSVYDSRYPWTQGNGMATLYNISSSPPVTMADAYLADGLAGDTENFDLVRHHGKINIAFCDGHVETKNISAADLQGVYLLAP